MYKATLVLLTCISLAGCAIANPVCLFNCGDRKVLAPLTVTPVKK